MTRDGTMFDGPVELLALADAADVGDGIKTIRLSPDGKVKSKAGDYLLDAEAGARIVAAFAEHRTDLVVDFEHQTLGGEYAAPDGRAPAAGWVSKVWHDAGRGLFGLVKWNGEARALIHSDAYRYVSPVFSVEIASRRAVALHSVGLTNKPAIVGMERVAASDRLATILHMNAEVRAMELIKQLADALRGSGATLAEDAGMEAVLEAALAALKSGDAKADGPAKAAAEENPLSGPVANSERLAFIAERDGLHAEVARLTTVQREREVQDVLDFAVNSFRVGKTDPRLDYIRTVAMADPANARKMVELIPSVRAPEGRLTPTTPLSDRHLAINSAAQAFRKDARIAKLTTCKDFVNSALHDQGLPKMTDAEAAQFSKG